MPLLLCATPYDFNLGEPRYDHLDSQGYELHNRKYRMFRLHLFPLCLIGLSSSFPVKAYSCRDRSLCILSFHRASSVYGDLKEISLVIL